MSGHDLGKLCIMLGLGIAFVGVIILVLSKWVTLGRLPGDIFVQKENFSFHFPIVSCLIISIILSVILNLFNR